LVIEAFADEEPWAETPADPAFFSKSFQNFKLSSAAMIMSVLVTKYYGCSRLTGSSKHLAVRAQAAVKNSALMGRNFNVLDQGRVTPKADRVVRETTGACNLLVVGAPPKTGDLRASVNAVDTSTGSGVPEVNVPVVGSTAGSEKVGLPRAPAESLDCSAVVGLGELRCVEGTSIPDGDQVIVATSSQLSTISTPLETTDLTNVVDELSNLVLSNADVVVVDETRTSTSGKNVLVPSHNTNTRIVTEHATKLGAFLNIPDLNLTSAETDTNVSTIAAPLDTTDVGLFRTFKKGVDCSRLSRPDVHVTLEADGDLVARAPVEKVQVVVVHQTRSIEHALWGGQDPTAELRSRGSSGLERTVVLRAKVNRLGRFGCCRLESQDASTAVEAASRGERCLISNSIRSRLGVLRYLIVISKSEVFKSSSHIIMSGTATKAVSTGSTSQDGRTFTLLGSGLLLVFDLDSARVDNGFTCRAAGDEAVNCVVAGLEGSLAKLRADVDVLATRSLCCWTSTSEGKV